MKPVLFVLAAFLLPMGARAETPPADAPPVNGPLWRADGGGVLPMAGSAPTIGNCWRVSVSLRLDAAAPPAAPPLIRGAPAHCQLPSIYIGDLRDTLFLEGVDANGGRLFVATGFNPLHQTSESPPGSGGGAGIQTVDRTAPSAATLISVPVGAPVVRIRWYNVDANQQPRLLGESDWAGAHPATP